MNQKRNLAAAICAAMLIAPMAGMAHHATSTFYTEEIIHVDGKIVEVVWANPHGVLVIQDGGGEYWVGEMASVLSLAQEGLGSADLPVGMEIRVDALSSRDGTHRIHIEAIQAGEKVLYGEPTDL